MIRKTIPAVCLALAVLGGLPCERALAADKVQGTWTQRGFDALSRGKFGNGGQNLYVSRAGVLQRIFQFDLNRDGWVDLVFCNSHYHWEKPPAYVYANPLGNDRPREVLSDGASCATMADLNGDGYDDLVMGMFDNGIRNDLNAMLYFGSPDGYSERRQLRLPAPQCRAVAAGDFNGDGRMDLAFLLADGVRVFYQNALGFEPKRFATLPVQGTAMESGRLTRDRCHALILRSAQGDLDVYWGAKDGLQSKRASRLKAAGPATASATGIRTSNVPVFSGEPSPLPRVVRLKGTPHLFMPLDVAARLIPVGPAGEFGKPLELACSKAKAIAVGDVNGDGREDLVVACREPCSGGERSWVYWGDGQGYDSSRRTALASRRACDVAVGDLDGGGCQDIVLCQAHDGESYTTASWVYRGSAKGTFSKPHALQSEDARRVFLLRPSVGKCPQVVLVNHCSRDKLGNPDAWIYLGGPDGYRPERRTELAAWGAVESLACDLNDDGYVDLLLANASENSVNRDPGSYVYLNGPRGYSRQPTLKLPTQRAHGACCADLNHDGYLDLVFGGFHNPDLVVFYGTARGFAGVVPQRIRMEYEGVVYKDPRWIYLADLNNDGWLDLVVPQILDDRSFVLWGGPQGFSMSRVLGLSVERAACARAADLDGNGYLDLILGGHAPSRVGPDDAFAYIYWNGPQGLRQDRRTMLPGLAINSMSVADFNRDGSLDLFLCFYHGGTSRDVDSFLYWNRKGPGFSENDCQRLATHSASGSVAADFNGDGWIDLAVANHKLWGDHMGYSAVWWNGPRGFNVDRTTHLPTLGPHGMTAMEAGNQADRGPQEYYESSAFELPDGASPVNISWVAQCPPKTWVKAQLRTAPAEKDLAKAAWSGPAGPGSWFKSGEGVRAGSLRGKWVQYRLALGSTNSVCTPRLSEVQVEYAAGCNRSVLSEKRP